MPRTTRTDVRLLAIASVLAWVPACAAARPHPHPDAAPVIVRTSTEVTEVGTLDGTPYRIDVPTAWNHKLVVFFHGYSETPYTYTATKPPNEQVEPIVERGYAVVESGYSRTGWALAEAYPETELLRLYFVKHYGQPAEGKAAKTMETLVVGGSMGGALVTAALEQNPKPYSGGLSLCGSIGPTDLAFQRRFAWRAAFDFYFPNLLPGPAAVPADYVETPALRLRVLDALRAKPEAATELRNLTWLHTDRELADAMVYFTYVIADMQQRSGGNPFDNRDFLYTGTTPGSTASDNALNDGVHRYTGDLAARVYLIHHYTPTGHLTHPMLELHTTYDPRVPTNTMPIYAEQVALAGSSQNFVEQYVKRDGHCNFTEDDIGRAFDELVNWIRDGRRPIPGALPPTPRIVR
jgi:pimeloyl-ACP methyl ester carboxylesterase